MCGHIYMSDYSGVVTNWNHPSIPPVLNVLWIFVLSINLSDPNDPISRRKSLQLRENAGKALNAEDFVLMIVCIELLHDSEFRSTHAALTRYAAGWWISTDSSHSAYSEVIPLLERIWMQCAYRDRNSSRLQGRQKIQKLNLKKLIT